MRSRMKVSILTVCEPHITTPLYLVCEEHYEEKCVKMPKKVAIKVKLKGVKKLGLKKTFITLQDPKHRCIWPERTAMDDHTC